jgi:hypothetical protein
VSRLGADADSDVVAPRCVALLIIGLKKNKEARLNNVMLLPEVGPEYAGFGLSGRF